jgi:hypothetical protein
VSFPLNTDPDPDFYNGDETLAPTKCGLDAMWPPTDKDEKSLSEPQIDAVLGDEAEQFEESSPNGRLCRRCQRTAKYFDGGICGYCAHKTFTEELQYRLSPSRDFGEEDWLQDRAYVGRLLNTLASRGFIFETGGGQFWVEPQPSGQIDLELRIYGHAVLPYIIEFGHDHWPPSRRSSDQHP